MSNIAPILWWKGENNAVESVNGVDATWLDVLPAYEAGQVGQCFRTVVSVINVFDIKTALTVANNPLFDFGPSDSFSVRFWFKQNSAPVSNTHIISMGPWWASNQSNWSIQIDEAGSLFITREGGYLPANSVGQITDTNWHDILMNYSDATWQFFLDGVDNGEAAIHFNGLHISTIPNLDLLIMGLRAGVPSTFDGSIDEIRIYDQTILPSNVDPVPVSMSSGSKKIYPIISNQRVTSYRSGTEDKIQIKYQIYNDNKGKLSYLKDVPISLYLNTSGWQIVESGVTDKFGAHTFYHSCSGITQDNCLGYVSGVINNEYYISNTVRMNFIGD